VQVNGDFTNTEFKKISLSHMNIRRLKFLLLIILLPFSFLVHAQIIYGSNNGKYITIKGTKVYYEEYGKGIPLLLLHGGFGSIHDFQKVIPELSKHFRVIALDDPGQGRSEQTDSISYQLYADYCSEFIDLMKLDSAYVIGFSDGGNTALLLGYDRPDKVKRAIISGADANISGYKPGGIERLESFTLDSAEVYLKDWIADFKKNSPNKSNWQKTFLGLRKMWLTEVVITDEKLSQIKSRFLIVLGDRDAQTLEHGIFLYRKIKGSEFCVLPNTTHQVFQEKPELINIIAINFFAEN
jgi:pimeloyl-ACP methyl ester carboxylesterase